MLSMNCKRGTISVEGRNPLFVLGRQGLELKKWVGFGLNRDLMAIYFKIELTD